MTLALHYVALLSFLGSNGKCVYIALRCSTKFLDCAQRWDALHYVTCCWKSGFVVFLLIIAVKTSMQLFILMLAVGF